ncbi:unnamed protein product [Angiostrongylus costaricensis]|uniref:Uncharacterized protein n=1 Tax=Angiostrongylus costaricensis TaxID=334426 RepID=A0A0R3PP85_ANGCS|nr:unnamed protein product [Angiostrongylus costaricensis]
MIPEKNCSEHATVEELAASAFSSTRFVRERRFIRTTYNPNRRFTIKKTWISSGFDNLRRLRADIKL